MSIGWSEPDEVRNAHWRDFMLWTGVHVYKFGGCFLASTQTLSVAVHGMNCESSTEESRTTSQQNWRSWMISSKKHYSNLPWRTGCCMFSVLTNTNLTDHPLFLMVGTGSAGLTYVNYCPDLKGMFFAVRIHVTENWSETRRCANRLVPKLRLWRPKK